MAKRFFNSIYDGLKSGVNYIGNGLEKVANFDLNLPKVPVITNAVNAIDRNIVKGVDEIGKDTRGVFKAGSDFTKGFLEVFNPQNLLIIGGVVVGVLLLRR